MQTTNFKGWFYSRLAIILASILVGLLLTIFGISSSFDAMKTAETAGIGNVTGGIDTAIVGIGVSFLGLIVGGVFVFVGFNKSRRKQV